jgi:glucoselysine-6-phosphate deglycase
MDQLMWGYIQEIPNVLNRILHSPHKLTWSGRETTLVMIGSGSSQHAFKATRNCLQQWTGCTVDTYYPHEFLDESKLIRRYDPVSTLVIGLSQTGTSSGTFAALRQAKGMGYPILTITGNDHSPIAQLGDQHLNLHCGEETCNAKTKGYSASLLCLLMLGLDLGVNRMMLTPIQGEAIRTSLQASIATVPEVIQTTVHWATTHPEWSNASTMVIIGHHDHTATAMEGALKLSETHYIPVLYSDVDEYIHGYHRLLDENSRVILIEGSGRGSASLSALVAYVRQVTPHVMHIGPGRTADIHTPQFDHVPSLFGSTAVFQVLAVLWPGMANQEPNALRHPDLVEVLKTIQLDVL